MFGNMKLLCLLALLVTANCSFLRTKKPPQPKTNNIIIPRDVLESNHHSLNKLRIATPEFCDRQVIKPEIKYTVLPWWYNYCSDLRTRKEIDAGQVKHFLPQHVKILKKVQEYKRKKAQIIDIINS
ncbi:uncharacterized protein LOC142976767 [Anticarsia gemmatalis]|uniref:uncharacterized protein LOC142976767 n=1 Tax=Anticarsia gemmatalis TaxID=129554 RepID=UPI003F768B5E